jgi:hypothetical protein
MATVARTTDTIVQRELRYHLEEQPKGSTPSRAAVRTVPDIGPGGAAQPRVGETFGRNHGTT